MRVLQLTREQRAAALAPDADQERTGVLTSGIVATGAGHQIALFFTGVRHARENWPKCSSAVPKSYPHRFRCLMRLPATPRATLKPCVHVEPSVSSLFGIGNGNSR
jgi:hypothetical protein